MSEELLKKRIADLESELHMYRSNAEQASSFEGFSLADIYHAADGVCVCHTINEFPFVEFTFWNRSMVDLTGYSLEEINRKGWYQSLYPDPDKQAEAIARMEAMRQGDNLLAETWEIIHADGKKRAIRISTSVLDHGDGVPRIIGIMYNVTEMQQAEETLRKEQQVLKHQYLKQSQSLTDAQEALKTSSARYEALFEIAGDALFIENDRDEILEVNQQACRLLGYTKEELLSMKVCDIQAPEYRGKSGSVLRTEIVDHQGKPFETMDLHKDGSYIPVEVTNNRLDEAGIYLSIVRDISERKKAEQDRRETFAIIEQSPIAAFLWRNEPNWPVEFVTRNVRRIFGYTEEDFLSGRIPYNSVIHPDDLEKVTQEVTEYSQEADRTAFTHEPYRILAKDGEVRWINDHTFIRRDNTGTISHYQGIVEDITAQKQMEAALSAEKNRLAVTLRSIGDAVITTDRAGQIVLMNPIAENLTGWREKDAMGRPLMEVFNIVDERTHEPCVNPVEKVIASGQTVELSNHTLLIARDSREFNIADSAAPIQSIKGDIHGVVLVFRDTTERQRLEMELLKMEKLKSLGVLAGGIAHDFNNFLTGIIGNLSLAKIDVQTGNPATRALGEMEKAAMRAKDLTQQLLTFSKGGAPVKKITSINELMRESALFALRGSNVRCEFEFEQALKPAEVDDGQIAQVIHNLVINADQAMPEGGTIVIKGSNISLAPSNQYALYPGKYIHLSISDQGSGIKKEYLKKVFDPYFSTKQKGSGLGLAVAYSIISKHDGQLTVDSTLGEGTTFTLLLPASEDPQVTDTDLQHGLVIGSGSILVMDDEDFIRDLASVMLLKIGYKVALAEDGEAAIKLYREALEAGKKYDAVILDLTIPGGMGGKETLSQLKALDPGVRAIVSSGYSNDPVMANHTQFGFCDAVKKPYLIQEMSQVLHTVINS